jgi:hypothetical protein
MRLTVYSSKGGVGKTPISIMFAIDHGFAVGSNESSSDEEDCYIKHMPDDMYLKQPMDEPFPLIPDDIDIVFDMAGTMTKYDHALVSAIKQSDVVIVPIWNNSGALGRGRDTLRALQGIAKRVIVVATKLQRDKPGIDFTETADYKAVASAVADVDETIKVLPLKFSTVYERVCGEFTTIHKLVKENKIVKRGQLESLTQIEKIYTEVGCNV